MKRRKVACQDKGQQSINSYFSKRKRDEETIERDKVQSQTTHIDSDQNQSSEEVPGTSLCQVLDEESGHTNSNENITLAIGESDSNLLNDIGKISEKVFSSQSSVTSMVDIRMQIFFDLYKPDENFNFPITAFGKNDMRFHYEWFKTYPWLAYSVCFDAAYCKYCIAFICSDTVGKGDNMKVGQLVSQPFKNWKYATQKFAKHAGLTYHGKCTVAADNFKNVQSMITPSIASQINTQRQNQVLENRENLKPIIESIIFCGEQELALRGHEHDPENYGPIKLDKPKKKDGNFRALLRFRANSGDVQLKDHLTNCPKNASYHSPQMQNEIIDICAKLIQRKIVKQANDSGAFSILADETLDVSGKEQLSLCVRFVDPENNIHEDFLTFLSITDTTAEAITSVILNQCESLGLNMNYVVGQGYDGVNTMSGQFNGVQAKIKELYPKALYVHCSSHKLNLVLSASLNGILIRNCLGTVNETCNLFRKNAYAGDDLKKNIKKHVPVSKKTRLLAVCETRFIERHDTILVFVELFIAIVNSLSDISNTKRHISSTADNLLSAFKKSQFIISLLSCEYLFSFTIGLSKFLQDPEVDLSAAYQYATTIIERLKISRTNIDVEFKKIFKKASEMYGELFNKEFKVPRVVARQTNRDNHPSDNAEEYYRRAIFTEALDNLISNLSSRFEDTQHIISSFQVLIPRTSSSDQVDKIKNLSPYFEDRTSSKVVESEYLIWCLKWEKEKVKTNKKYPSIPDILDNCDRLIFPNIHHLLRILATLPG